MTTAEGCRHSAPITASASMLSNAVMMVYNNLRIMSGETSVRKLPKTRERCQGVEATRSRSKVSRLFTNEGVAVV